ncbi:MAG: ribosome silencing factor [Planctomycetes bacterium]|nr:ribosome silencing factor [Planctomycetota bacterium]
MAIKKDVSRERAIFCAKNADNKKASDIIILNVQKLLNITDYFVICTADNPKHVEAIIVDIEKEMKSKGSRIVGIEGMDMKTWALIDLGDVVVHVMQKQIREYYQIEELWADAKKVNWKLAARRKTS